MYGQLLAEGYLTSRVGAGTFVTELAMLPAPARPFAGLLSPQPKAVPRTTGVISFNPGPCRESSNGAIVSGPIQQADVAPRAAREA